jgi:hypothetical protein
MNKEKFKAWKVYQEGKEITGYKADSIIQANLLGYGPFAEGSTPASYNIEDLENIVMDYPYSYESENSAQKCFEEFQEALESNLNSLWPYHCQNCGYPRIQPIGWSIEMIKKVLEISPRSITKIIVETETEFDNE